MKRIYTVVMFFVVFGISATLSSAQTNVPRKTSVYVPPPMGSHLGGGYVRTDEADNNKSTAKLGTENTTLGKAVASLDAKAATVVDGYALMPTAVSWQTKVPTEVLKKQRAKSGLTYGQLLVANSLASGSGKSFEQILALRAKTRDWSQLAGNLHVDVNSIVARLKAADESVTYAQARGKLRRDQNINATDFQRGGRTRLPGGG
jgi:hypothetical protein